MPYININEYDYTITGPKSIGGNIVAIPINASDGPSDRWVTVHRYDDFVQMFGSDPLPNGDFGSSWQYAANLLMRNMSVCVRRITHTLDEDGINKELLPGVSVAKTIVKLKNINSDNTSLIDGLQEDKIDIKSINLDDTKMILSNKGQLEKNPLYKTNDNIVEGELTSTAFETPLALEAATIDVKTDELDHEVSGTFADVTYTNSEWSYIGTIDNPHYKYETKDEPTPMTTIIEKNPTGILGDFYVNEDGHVVKYSSAPVVNENWQEVSITYPSELSTFVSSTKNPLTKDSFVDVIYNEDNTKKVNTVWIYTPNETTTVTNHKYFRNTSSADGSFATEKELNAAIKDAKNINEGYFAQIKDKIKLYTYSAEQKKFIMSDISADSLTTPGPYGSLVNINFKQTNVKVNSGLYRHTINWKNTGESGEVNNGLELAYIDINNKELVFTKKIHWQNTERAINKTKHEINVGATRNINKLIISKTSNLTSSNIDLQYTQFNNSSVASRFSDQIIKDTDNEHRLTSGILGITNTGTEPINLYSFKIKQKMDKHSQSEDAISTTIYDMNIENITNILETINKDSLLKFKDNEGNVKELPIAKLDESIDDGRRYIEIPVGYSLYYDANLSNASLEIEFTGSVALDCDIHLFKSTEGEYVLRFSATDPVSCTRYSMKETSITEEISYDDIAVNDGRGNVNMFKVEYVYPGSNGNYINVKLQTLQSRGIYLLVYRNNQFLEQIELCNFRHRLSNNKVITLDLELNKVEMWRLLLSNFGIRVDASSGMYDVNKSNIKPITGKYVSVYFNENIIKEDNGLNTLDYITLLYGQIKQGISNTNSFSLQTGKDPSDEHVKHEIPYCFEPLKDKYRYDITFVCNGGYVDNIVYPNDMMRYYNGAGSAYRLIEDAMLGLADSRKDCVAFLDVPYDLPLESVPSYFSHLSTSYAAAYDPWALIVLATGVTKWMSPSFVQLYTHAKSIMNGNKMYLPPAGVRRAQATEVIKTNHDLPSKYIKAWQDSDTPQYINPIIWINGYDYTIYGQKTLFSVVSQTEKYQSALQDLNVRLVANKVKKLIWATCINLTFELNSLMTWNEFKAKVDPELSAMLGEGTLTGYEIIMDQTTMTKADLNSGHVCGTVRLAIVRAATDWDINLVIEPNTVTFNEIDYGSTYNN